MKQLLRKITAAAVVLTVLLLALTACGDDDKYASLSEDIVGIWMDAAGPEVYYNEDGETALRFYEFTSDGRLIYHTLAQIGDIISDDTKFTIEKNYFVVDTARCLLSIDGNNMSMTNDSGVQNYVRLSVEEATNYAIYYVDEDMYSKQVEYINELLLEQTDDQATEGNVSVSSNATESGDENTGS